MRETVERILEDIRARGDMAVRETVARLRSLGAEVVPSVGLRRSERLIGTITEAGDRGHQIRPDADPPLRRGADGRTARYRDRDAARHPPRPQEHPGRQRRLLCAGRALSDGRLGAYERADREGGRREAGRRLHAAAERRAARRDGRSHVDRGRRRNLHPWRRAGGRCDGAGDGE